MKTAEAAKGRWAEIFEYYGLPPFTGKHHYKGECPVCKARGKFRVDDRDGQGTWICVCGSGDGMKLLTLTQSKSFSAICAEVDQLIGNNYQRINVPANSSAARQRQRVISKFSKLLDLRGTSAAGYLLQRGISRLPAEGIRFCDRQRHAGRVYQALYALATDEKLSFVTCTRRCWTATGRQILIAPNVLSRFKRTAIWITPALWPFACFRYQRRSASPKVSKQHSPVIRFMASIPGR